MIYITASGSKTVADSCTGILIQVNAPLTGTITVTDGGVTKAVLASVVPVGQYRYYGFTGAVAVNPSASCDITVSILQLVV
jgi:hypothetical protein